MFDTTWKNKTRWRQEADALSLVTPAQGLPPAIEAMALLDWYEHCLECAPPECYQECMLYKAREDKKCVRLEYGLFPDDRFSGIFGYGVDCRFRRWAKLECRFNPRAYSPAQLRWIDRCSRWLSAFFLGVSKIFKSISPTLKPIGVFTYYRGKLLARVSKNHVPHFDAFLLECYSLEDQTFRLMMQCDQSDRILWQNAFEIRPGYNTFSVPFEDFGLGPEQSGARIFLCPENDREARLVFTYLDFVRFVTEAKPGSSQTDETAKPADKVKCIAWDLDNTLWKGVLIEEGVGGISLNEDVLDIIKELDQRGIIHTIVSKNTEEEAWSVIKSLGIEDYFIYPAINWGPKSENLRQVANRININLNTFAFIDDSPFERAEVSSELPMVRVFPETRIRELTQLPEFDVPITEMSKSRRLSYLAEMKREEFRAMVKGDNLAFLRSCKIGMEVFVPHTEAENKRCMELLLRSNQLNLSSYRYTAEEYAALLDNPEFDCYGFRCEDRFGEYGIVGFLSVRRNPSPQIVDLVISCRIAKKRVEHALIDWLGRREKARGNCSLTAKLVKAYSNSVLVEVFRDLPFDIVREDDKSIEYVMDVTVEHPREDIVAVGYREDVRNEGDH